MHAQARVWASDVALSVPDRVLKVMSRARSIDPADFARLSELGGPNEAVTLQAGRLADMHFIAGRITAR